MYFKSDPISNANGALTKYIAGFSNLSTPASFKAEIIGSQTFIFAKASLLDPLSPLNFPTVKAVVTFSSHGAGGLLLYWLGFKAGFDLADPKIMAGSFL